MRALRAWPVAVAFLLSALPALAGGLALIETQLTDNGDQDGFADTRERVELRMRMRNTSGAALSDVHLQLATETPERVCITTATVDLGDLAIGEIKLSPSFLIHVLDVDRAGLGLDAHDYYSARFRLMAAANGPTFPQLLTPAIELDLDLDVSGGAGPTTFMESFEGTGSGSLGAFAIDNIDQGKHSLEAADGYRCQYTDPAWAPQAQAHPACYFGASASAADAVNWRLSGPSYSPLQGRAFSGLHSLYFGVDVGPPRNWTTASGVLEAARTSQPIYLGHAGASPVLALKQQVSLADDRCFGLFPDGSWDRAVLQVQLADELGLGAGPWVKLYAFENGYDKVPVGLTNFLSCMFDPIDDGNTEDDFFFPTDPLRTLGPSSMCAPDKAFAAIGETSDLFDADNVGGADGPGLAGFWGIGTWIESKFDLSRFRGRGIRLRLLASTNKLTTAATWDETFENPKSCDDGWWIDDVTVTGALATAATVAVDAHDNSGLPGPPAGDVDLDSVLDACDNCTGTGNLSQGDHDVDGLGDACDPCPVDHALLVNADPDSDLRCVGDNCPFDANYDQANLDFDPVGDVCDCDPDDDKTYPGAVERNDQRDNQCPGDPGYGVVDELTAPIMFFNKDILMWEQQLGATRYAVARASKADYSAGCTLFTLPNQVNSFNTTGLPLSGQIRFFLVRPIAPNVGSWGQNSAGVERNIPCAP